MGFRRSFNWEEIFPDSDVRLHICLACGYLLWYRYTSIDRWNLPRGRRVLGPRYLFFFDRCFDGGGAVFSFHLRGTFGMGMGGNVRSPTPQSFFGRMYLFPPFLRLLSLLRGLQFANSLQGFGHSILAKYPPLVPRRMNKFQDL